MSRGQRVGGVGGVADDHEFVVRAGIPAEQLFNEVAARDAEKHLANASSSAGHGDWPPVLQEDVGQCVPRLQLWPPSKLGEVCQIRGEDGAALAGGDTGHQLTHCGGSCPVPECESVDAYPGVGLS